MTLDRGQHTAVTRNVARRVSAARVMDMGTDDIKAASDAASVWTNANFAAFEAALPEPFRSTATLEEKQALLSDVSTVKFDPKAIAKAAIALTVANAQSNAGGNAGGNGNGNGAP